MGRIYLAMIIGGGFLVFYGFQEYRLASAMQNTPQKITCEQLGASGPGKNAYVDLEEFLLCNFSYIYEVDEDNRWRTVYIPAVPLGGEFHQKILEFNERIEAEPEIELSEDDLPMPTNIQVIIKSKKVNSDAQVEALANQDSIRGVVINKIEKLGEQERNLLASSYPGINFKNVWIIEERREPSNRSRGAGISLAGLVLLFFGGYLVLNTGGSDD